MRIAIAQLNYTVGDLGGNFAKILDAGQRAAAANARLLVTSELAICGYPPLDLLNQQGFVQTCIGAASELGEELGTLGVALLIGCPWHRGIDGFFAEVLPLISIEEMSDIDRHLHNSALLFDGGELKSVVHKRLLPTYDVFDERRWFTPGAGTAKCIELDGVKLGVHICEDAWNTVEDGEPGREDGYRRNFYGSDPVSDLVDDGADLLINLSASPWRMASVEGYMPLGLVNKIERENIELSNDSEHNHTILWPRNWERGIYFDALSEKVERPILFVNQVGANDSLIFDGKSLVAHPDDFEDLGPGDFLETVEVFDFSDGRIILDRHAGTTFECPKTSHYATSQHRRFHDSERFGEQGSLRQEDSFEMAITSHVFGPHYLYMTAALEMGVRDYVRKTGHEKVIIGLSGGIDSALVTTIACHAIGPENVRCIGMPTRYSSKGSISDSEELCKNLGCSFEVYPIEESFEQFEKLFKGSLDGLALENIQPRIRGTILMALANQTNALVLAPGNKSELAVGYSTLYGDTVGCLEVIGDVYKSDVWRLSRFYNRAGELIPKAIIDKEPSAELREEQRDSDSLPPYNILDPILRLYIDHALAVESIIEMEDDEVARFDEATVRKVCRMVDIAEFKRKQSPMVLRVSSRAFGPGRQMPVVNGYRPLG